MTISGASREVSDGVGAVFETVLFYSALAMLLAGLAFNRFWAGRRAQV